MVRIGARLLVALAPLFGAFYAPLPTAAQTPLAPSVPPPKLKDVGFDQRLDQQVPLDLAFVDDAGRTVTLRDYFNDKPVVLVLAYYRCPMLCTLVLNAVASTIEKVPQAVGKDFQVVTVSFDPRETWELAAAKKKNLLARYARPGAEEGWHFLTGKAEPIRELTQAAGFRYVYDEKNDMYVHPAGIMVLTPSGKISRYLFGVDFLARDLRLALVEASAGQIASPSDQVLLYCFHYDPASGKYTAAVMRFVRLGGILTMVGVAGLVWFLVRKHRRKGIASP
jgi:protein SCO1/2